MVRQTTKLLAAIAVVLLAGCSGKSLGLNEVGESTDLEGGQYGEDGIATGSIAIDDDTEKSFVLAKYQPVNDFNDPTKKLLSIDPDNPRAEILEDYTGFSDVRMAFPEDRILVMAQEEGEEQLRLFDTDRLNVIETETIEAEYHGTRISPSNEFLAVKNSSPTRPAIHIIDTESLEHIEIPSQNALMEAMWTHNRDQLVTISSESPAGTQKQQVKLKRWTLDGLDIDEDIDQDWWENPDLSTTVDNARWDRSFSHTWISVGPNDRYATFPVRETDPQTAAEYTLLVWDLQTGDLRKVSKARGPAAFTPDGSSMIAYRKTPYDAEARLMVIDVDSLDVETYPVPNTSAPSYFVTPEGNRVVVASATGTSDLVLYDLDNLETTTVSNNLNSATKKPLQIQTPDKPVYRDIRPDLAEHIDRVTTRNQFMHNENDSQEASEERPGISTFRGDNLKLSEFINRVDEGELWLADDGLHRLDYLEGTIEHVATDIEPLHINYLPNRDKLIFDGEYDAVIQFFDPESQETTETVRIPRVD
jgi:hypothetical protein